MATSGRDDRTALSEPLHKRHNQSHRDQGVHASNGDAEIQTAHHVLGLELVLFVRHRNLPCVLSALQTSRGRRGFVPAGKYKSELKGKVLHGEHATASAIEYFSLVPVGNRTDEVSIQRYGEPCPAASAAQHRGNGQESPPVGLPLRAGFRINISTRGHAPPWWERRVWGGPVAGGYDRHSIKAPR
jgi:hypothetical protein